jgi:hypothetical protein
MRAMPVRPWTTCWTILVLMQIVLCVHARAQSYWFAFFVNGSHDLPPGVYVGQESQSIYVVGGTGTGAMPIPYQISGNPINLSIGEGSTVTNVRFRIANGTLVAKGCKFVNCHFHVADAGTLSLEGCVLVGCSIPEPTESDVALWKNGTARVTLNNTVVAMPAQVAGSNGRRVIYNLVNPSKQILQVTNCTFMGMGMITSTRVPQNPENFVADAKAAGSFIRSSTFQTFSLYTAVLLISEQCSFDSSNLAGYDPSYRTEGRFTVKAQILPRAEIERMKERCPDVRVQKPEVAPSGSTIKAQMANMDVTSNLVLVTSPPISVVSALPQPPPVNVPSAPGSQPVGPTTAPPKLAPGAVTGTAGAPDSGLKKQLAQTHGLLIMSLDRGQAGSASKLSAIALDIDKTLPAEVSFNQKVGDMMTKALGEVGKFTQLRHKGWPKGYKIELSFEDKYSNKDGPSAAVACALLLNSLITGKENDPQFAVTGDMNSDGSVQPIGGVAAKIRGATNGKCKLVAIPVKNESSLGDLLLSDGPAPFAKIQVYSISSFDEAEALALMDKPAPTQNAIAEMAAVQQVLLRDPGQIGSWLRNPHVIAKLQAVQKLAPNNLSAKYLLMFATGKVPQSLSLAGSLDAVENAAADLISSIKANKGQNANALRKDVVGSSITKLQSLRAKCDPRLRAYAEAIIRFGSAVKEAQDRPANSAARASVLSDMINTAAGSADSEFNRLINDPKIREELEL